MPLFEPVSKFFTKMTSTGISAGEPSVFIGLTATQECTFLFAIDACAKRIADEMNGYFEIFGVNWHDEHLPQIIKDARNLNELQSSEISFAESKRRSGKAL